MMIIASMQAAQAHAAYGIGGRDTREDGSAGRDVPVLACGSLFEHGLCDLKISLSRLEPDTRIDGAARCGAVRVDLAIVSPPSFQRKP